MKIKNYIEANEMEIINDLSALINIPSVIDEESHEKPFGKPIDEALKWTLNKFEKLGMKTFYDPKGYYGYAEIGEGSELIGILAHVDVVPSGDEGNWTFPPFDGVLSGGKLYGRGATDDKGPIIAILHAMKALIAGGITFNKRVRVIIGTDEENQWRGICHYMRQEEVPAYGFTPDSDFPVVYAEKGLLQVKLKSELKSSIRVKGGNAMNSVPESATYHGSHLYKLEKQLKKMGFDHELEGDELYVIGKSAHSAKPHMGVNAVTRMVMALKALGVDTPAVDFIAEKIALTTNGELIFGSCEDEPSGKLTMSVNQIDISKYGEVIGMDIRIPVTVDKKFIALGLKRVAEKFGLKYEELDYLEPVYLSKDHPLIQTLKSVYEEETGLDGTPMATGGATYARSMKNCVAFGPNFPGTIKIAHQTDEYIEVNALIKCTQIYAKAIERLIE